jgi:hypothetical protein
VGFDALIGLVVDRADCQIPLQFPGESGEAFTR